MEADLYRWVGGKTLATNGTVVNDGTTLMYRASKYGCDGHALPALLMSLGAGAVMVGLISAKVRACKRLHRISFCVFCFSLALYATGFYFAFLAHHAMG